MVDAWIGEAEQVVAVAVKVVVAMQSAVFLQTYSSLLLCVYLIETTRSRMVDVDNIIISHSSASHVSLQGWRRARRNDERE
jgi:hypothetical protein